MIDIITILISTGLGKIFSFLKDNWYWIIFNIISFLVVFIWICEVVDKAEKARMRKWEAEEMRFKRIEELLKKIIQLKENKFNN